MLDYDIVILTLTLFKGINMQGITHCRVCGVEGQRGDAYWASGVEYVRG